MADDVTYSGTAAGAMEGHCLVCEPSLCRRNMNMRAIAGSCRGNGGSSCA
ncbi:hypothetical protein VXQ18_03715 [Brucella abortus]|nr:hypothetical protein [Brucella abortus]